MIKGLLKFVFRIIATALIVIAGVFLFIYFSIRDTTNEIPIHLYSDSITLSSEINDILYSSFDDLDNLEVSVSEDDLNIIIYAILKEKYPNYLPSESCSSATCNALESHEITLPLVGVKSLQVKGIYSKLIDEEVKLFIVLDIMGIPSTVNGRIKFTNTDGLYTIEIKRLALGKLNILSGIGKVFLQPLLDVAGFSETSVNQKFEDKNIPITYNSKQFSFTFRQEDIIQIIKSITSEETQHETVGGLLEIFEENPSLIYLGFINEDELNRFGLKLDMDKLKVNDRKEEEINNISLEFNLQNFISAKTQSVLLANLKNNPSMNFTDYDFNQIIYDKTNGYANFNLNYGLPNGSNLNIKVEGIIITFTEEKVFIEVVLNINDLVTIISLEGDIIDNASTSVKIKLNEEITIGKEPNKNREDYLVTRNKFLFDLFADQFTSLDVIKYDKETYTFTIDSESINILMNHAAVGEGTILTAESIKIIDGAITVLFDYSDDFLNGLIADGTAFINDYLGNQDLNINNFITNSPEQEQVVSEFLNTLEDMKGSLANNEDLTDEQINNMIQGLNNLDNENKEIFINDLEAADDSSILNELYTMLFN